MLKIQNIDNICTGCSACHNICPHSAIKVVERNGGFYYPEVDEEKCVGCGLCEKTCPAISPENTAAISKAYMFKASDDAVVYNSSSGGMFTVLAEWILEKKGVVYGARYDYQARRLEHSGTDECGLEELKKSKYIESYIGDTYKKVRKNLKDGRYVLFVGTPCQVSGLYKYLGSLNASDRLITVDFVCHGVPSNQHFSEYIRYQERKNASSLVHFDFRPKEKGWKGNIFKMQFDDGKILSQPFIKNLYYYAFNNNWMLRESCYNCSILKTTLSDITIGDFWGVKNMPEYKDDNKGISVVIAHSAKGEAVMKLIRKDNFSRELSYADIDYIYEDRSRDSRYDLGRRQQLLKEVSERNYVHVVKHHYWKEMIWHRLRMSVSEKAKAILRLLGLWKRK